MDKIFDPEVQEYLRSAGVTEKNINKIMFDSAKANVLTLIENIKKRIEKNEFNRVYLYIAESPAGDEMGMDNSYIDFSSCFAYDTKHDTESLDISTMLIRLEKLCVIKVKDES